MESYYFDIQEEAIEYAKYLRDKYSRFDKHFAVVATTDRRSQVCGLKHAINVEKLGRVGKILYASDEHVMNIINGTYTPRRNSKHNILA